MTTFTSPLSFRTSSLQTAACALGFSLAALTAPTANANPTLVEICHTNGNGTVSSLFVNANAVPALLATGRRGGLAVALLFHLLVVLTPPPNNAGGCSVGAWLAFSLSP